MLRAIKFSQIDFLHKLKLNLSHLKYLESLSLGEETPNDKFITDLEKVGMVLDGAITEYGKITLAKVSVLEDGEIVNKKSVKKANSPEFLEWWEQFPSTDVFECGGESFNGVRSLRSKKEECATKYDKLLVEFDHETLMKCLKFEVDSRMDQSVVRGENLLTYMKGTISYLNSRGFEAYLKLIKKGNGEYQRKTITATTINTKELF